MINEDPFVLVPVHDESAVRFLRVLVIVKLDTQEKLKSIPLSFLSFTKDLVAYVSLPFSLHSLFSDNQVNKLFS